MVAPLLDIARTCMQQVYNKTKPSPAYVERGTRLLLGTAATESRFEHRRQLGFGPDVDRGAWGLWQTESAPLLDGLKYLQRRPELAHRAAQWLYRRDAAVWPYMYDWDMRSILRVIYNDDRMGCLMARIHYMRFPPPIPESPGDQGAYYKRYYNTDLGQGSASKFVDDYVRLVLPILKGEIA